LIVADVVNLQSTGIGVPKDHVARARDATEIADTRELPVQADIANEEGAGDPIVAYVVDPEVAGIGVAQHHVGIAGGVYKIHARDAAEIADAKELPIRTHRPEGARAGELIVADVVDLECAAGVAQQHVAGSRAIVETAESDKPPIGSDWAQGLRVGRDRITSDPVDLIETVRTTQDHDGGGADPKSEGFHELDVRGRELGESRAKTDVIECIIWREIATRRAEKVGRAVTSGPIRHFLCATVDRKICRRRGV
jgi:hypothetical protein